MCLLEVEARGVHGALELAGDLLIAVRLDDDRDVSSLPTLDDRAHLERRRDDQHEDDDERQNRGIGIAAKYLNELAAHALGSVRWIHQGQAARADRERQRRCQEEHRQADPPLVDEVGSGNERDQPRAEVGDRDSHQQHDPQQRTRRHACQKQLLALWHAPEQHQRRPAEDHLHQPSELASDESD